MSSCQLDNPNQIFQFHANSHHIFHGGLCLDYDNSTGSNNNVQLFACHDGLNQKWYYDGETKALKTLQDPDMCLDWGYDNLYMYECHGKNNQMFEIPVPWRLSMLVSFQYSVICHLYHIRCINLYSNLLPYFVKSSFFIGNQQKGMVLGLEGACSNGVKLGLQPTNSTEAGQYFFKGSNEVLLSVKCLGMVIDLEDSGGCINGVKIQLWDRWNGNNQKWKINNDLSIESIKCGGFAIDYVVNSKSIQLWTKHSKWNQVWSFIPVSASCILHHHYC